MRNKIRCPENPLKDYDERALATKSSQSNEAPPECSYAIAPQPHFIPGYTGWTPGAGPQRHFIVGDTYGRYTHQLLHEHCVGGARLNPLNSDLKFVNAFVSPPRQDPKQLLQNPHKSLDPYFVPGYTGFIPDMGIRRCDAVGESFGRMSHLRLAKHRVVGDRLRPIYEEPPEYVANGEEVKFYCNLHEVTASDLLRRFGTVPGYAGHMPRALFRHGKTVAKINNEATAEFEMIMENKKL